MADVVERRKIPVTVSTIQWTGDNAEEIKAFTGPENFRVLDPEEVGRSSLTARVYDRLHDTWVGVTVTDHITRGVMGEYYPIADEIVRQTYEVAGQSAQINAVEEVTATELYDLRRDARKLRALEAAGVDNWSGYETAMEIMREEQDG